MSSEVVDFKARSMEGRGLSMKAQERWVDIQKHTFLNWVNLQLQGSGMTVTDPEEDFDDGVRLCALVESLQNRKIGRIIKKPLNHHQNLENVTLALNAIAEDNVRLVNIGSEDIVNGSTKLILGLVWTLILRYQIGKTKIPPKKLMLAWLKAVVPECAISNFTSDWNDGVALHALIDYCQPGLCPDWRQLSRHSRLENCTEAMELAKEKLNIPIVVRPEDFCSSHLDDLSGMTYLSYFMMVDAPGYLATRREIRALLHEGTVENFTTDWNDGRLLANLVSSVGGNPPELSTDSVVTLQNGINSAKLLGIDPIFSAKEMADPEVEHLGVMAYAAYFRKFESTKKRENSARMRGEFDDVMVRQEKHFTVTAEDGTDHSVIRLELAGPDSVVPVRMDWIGDTADCYFTPTETGHHKLNVLCDEKPVPGCPVSFKVLSDRSKVHFEKLDRAVVGNNSELTVNTTDAGEGEVRMEATSPGGKVVNMPVMYKNGIHLANFTPSEVGDWEMSVMYESEHVTGSPYTLPVFDPSMVEMTAIETGKVGQESTFNVDATFAGDGELTTEVLHNGWTVQCPLEQGSMFGRYKGSFVPQTPGTYTVHIYFNDMEVRGSPQEVEIVDTTRVTVTGEGLSLVPVNTPAIFTIHTEGAGGGKIDVDITAPSGYKVPWNIRRLNKDTYKVEYRVTQPGEYTINVQFGGQEVTKTPFVTKAYDSKRLVVSNMPAVASRDKPVEFNIDASQAGSGNIEIRVNEGRVPCSVENKGNHRFVASFMPENSRPHAVEMTFNNTAVDGSPWSVNIVDKNNIKVSGDEWVPIHRSASATVRTNGQKVSRSDLQIGVTGPEGESVPFNLGNEADGDHSVKYTPTLVGNYEISVKYGNQEVVDSPFVAKAYNVGAILVTPLKDGFVNQPMAFTIDVGDAGEGQLQIMVNNGNIRNEVEPMEPGTYRIKFVPVEIGRQEVVIKFNDINVPNSPLTCQALALTANVIGLDPLIPVLQESSFTIQSQSPVADINTDVSITGPTGHKVPVRMRHTGDRKVLDLDYTPRDIGTHTVNIAFNGHHIKGSPFQVKTFDPDQVKVTKVMQGIVGVPCKFKVDASNAGDGTLEIAVTNGGHIVPNSAQPLGNNCYEISFLGESEGPHKVSVTYNGIHAQGSPYTVPMLDVGDMQIVGDAWNLIKCHQPGQFTIRHGQDNSDELHVKITGPDGSNVPNRLSDRGNGTARIDWTPNQIGTYKVYVDYGGIPIKGSPFSIRVFDASMVKVSGINSGLVNRPVNFTLDASKAGEGNLEILVMCENEIVPNYVTQEGQTKFRVNFTPKKAGLHVIHMQFNGESLRGSPHNCQVFDPESVYVSGDGINMAPANQQTSFMVNMKNAGDAKLNVKVVSPHGDEVPVHFSGNPKTGIKIDYTPYDVGVYKVYVDCGGVPVSGSPFTCNVFDQSLIRINAPGRAYLGKPIRFHVDASSAGEGNLNFQVKCHGTEVPVRIQETARDRYDVTFTPQKSMTHHVLVFYNNIQVPGTPFDVPVIDSNSIKLSGDGPRLTKIYKEARLNLEHQGLDERDLDVHVVGPSGGQIPARISRHGKLCGIEFTPMEVGVHKVIINVGDTPVNGSPFKCNVYDPSAVRIIEIDKTPTKEREIGFTIDSGSAGTGDLEVTVTHKGHPVPAKCRQIGEGRYTYSFKPLNVGRYEVKATFNGETIPGSPLIIDVEEDHPTFIRINMSSSEPINTQGKNYFLLHMNGRNVERDMLNIIVLAPNGEKIAARLIQQPDGDYKVEWTPNNPGRHSVDVLYGGQQIQGSPFYIDVFDIHKIRVNNFYCGNIGEKAGFRIDCTQAGQGDQEIRVQSPTGRIVSHHVEETSHLDYNVSYTPVEVGTHQVFISYSGMELNVSSVDEPIHILNELQSYLSQFGGGDSIRGDGHSGGGYHVPISLVSYSPKGLTPRFGSAKNSPRLIKQHSSTSLSSPRWADTNSNKRDGKNVNSNKGREEQISSNNDKNDVQREIINTVIMDNADTADTAGEKTTQFNWEFFQKVDNSIDRNMIDSNNNDNNNNEYEQNGIDGCVQTNDNTNSPNTHQSASFSIGLPVDNSNGVSADGRSLFETSGKVEYNGDPNLSGLKVNSVNNSEEETTETELENKRKTEQNVHNKDVEKEENGLEENVMTGENSESVNLNLDFVRDNDLHDSHYRGGENDGDVVVHNSNADENVGEDGETISNLGLKNGRVANSSTTALTRHNHLVAGGGDGGLEINPNDLKNQESKSEDIASKMGNSSSSSRKYSSNKKDSKNRRYHLDAWSNGENIHHYEEMRENVSNPSEDSNSNSYSLDVSIDNVLYKSSGDSTSSSFPIADGSNGASSNAVRGTQSSDSGFSSPGVKKEDNAISNKGLGRKKRSFVRMNSSFSDLESALAVPELIIDALGEDANYCGDEDSPLPESVTRITAFDASTLALRKIDGHEYEDVEVVSKDRNDDSASSSSGSDNKQKNVPSVSSPTADSSTHFPMIYRRSKNDPGDKQYKEVVRELSFVLEKRSADEQRQSIRDKLHLLNDDGKRKEEREAQTVSKSSDSINVLGNKSLLMKLENHFRGRGASNNNSSANTSSNALNLGDESMDSAQHENKGLKVEITEQGKSRSNDYLAERSSETAEGKVGANSVSIIQNAEAANSNTGTLISSPNSDNMDTLYSKPNKRFLDTYGKRVSAKLIYDHHKQHSLADTGSTNNATDGYESIARDLNFVSEQNISVSDSEQDVSKDKIRDQDGLNSNFIISGVRLDGKNVSNVSRSTPSTTHHYVESSDKGADKSLTSGEYVGHSLSWARNRVDTAANFRGKVLTTSGSQKGDRLSSENNVNMGNVKKQQRRRATANAKRHSLDDTVESSTSSNGHLTTIGIEGRGLNQKSIIMYSEPDIASIGREHSFSRKTSKPVSELNVPRAHLHNESSNSLRDLSFSSSLMDETGIYFFDSNSFSSETSFDTRQQFLKLNIDGEHLGNQVETGRGVQKGSGNDLDRETYFISTRKRPPPSSGMLSPTHSIVTNPRPHSISMTTIVEQGDPSVQNTSSGHRTPSFRSVIDQRNERTLDNKHVSVVRTTSLRSDSPTQFYSSNNSIKPSSNVTRSQTMVNKSYSSQPFNRLWRTGSSASASSSSSSTTHHHHHHRRHHNQHHGTTSDRNTLYVVVPHKSSNLHHYQDPHSGHHKDLHNISIPDLIVDHQLQHVATATTTTHSSIHKHKHGSPFHQEIFEGVLPSASGDGLHRGEEDKPASFVIDARRMSGEPTVQVDGPNSIAKCNIDHLPDGQYKVTYIPVEVGIFTAQVKWNGKDIPGSPFYPKIVNALKVRVIGGWQHYMDSQERVHLVVGEEKQIPFDTSEAGSGHMRAEVKSPSAFIPVTVDEEIKGKSVVKFVPQEEGNHYINLYWCDHPLVNSPYLGYATSGVADPSKVILSGRGVKEGVVREEAEFIIDGSQAGPGEPDVQLIGVRAEIQVFTTPLGGGKYRCTYIPVIPGAYLLHISWNGRQLRGSPYKVNVIGASYPNRVIVNGEGLKGGLLNQNLDFRIDTRKAGPGELTAYCMGPTKVAYCELSDHHDGTYRLAVRAQEVGRHVLQIKYGGEHVQGSPFAFKVSAQPDASKVRVSGPGVEHGILANFQSNFIVETKGAGAGQLTVRIRGPRGAFQVEMYRESHKDRTILCRYYPTVTGLYIINIRWSGVDVPGSPFHVNILDTHQELEHVLRDQGFTPNGHQTSFHNNHAGLINNHNNSRISYHHSQNHAHNTSRSSGYYAWRGDD